MQAGEVLVRGKERFTLVVRGHAKHPLIKLMKRQKQFYERDRERQGERKQNRVRGA